MIKTVISDSKGKGRELKISEGGQVEVLIQQRPPVNELNPAKPFRSFFTNSSDSSDMQVVASSSSHAIYSIRAIADKDIYVKTISIVIADAGATLNNFGNITALSNGVELKWTNQKLGDTVIASALTSNWDFMRLALGNPSFGGTTDTFRASNVLGNSEGYIPVIDFSLLFGLQYGLKLAANTKDSIDFIIKDNTTGVDQFDAIAYGIEI